MLVKIVNILILTAYINLGVSTKSHPPNIFLPEEYVLQSNQNLTIKCEASEPIFWTYPKNTINGQKFSHFAISYCYTSGEENVHVAILAIVNISFVDTGFYYCHGKGQSLDSNRSSKIYLFVKDDEHLTVLDDIETIYTATPYSEAILPCRPTSLDTNVKLYRSSDDSEVQPGQRQEDGSFVKFDPRYGFSFVKHENEEINWNQTIVYICSFFRDHITQNITMLHSMQPMTSIAVPHIENVLPGYSIEGDVLILNCTLVCNVQFSMTWTVPNPNGFKTGRITESSVNSTDSNTHFKMITIRNLTKADQGSYTCLVENMISKNNNSFEVKILGTDELFLKLIEEKHLKKRKLASLLRLALNLMQKQKLKAKPTVFLQMKYFHFIDTLSTAKCTAAGYPPAQIFWSFKPCLDNSCPSKEILSNNLQRNNTLFIKSKISIKASQTGLLTCFANNTEGNRSYTVPFYITDVKNGFTIKNSPNLIEVVNSTVKKVAIGETLEFNCSASLYNYTNVIDWYRGPKKIVKSDREYLETSHTQYSYKTKLVLSNVTKADSGNYSCKVIDKNKNPKELNITIQVLEPFPPRFVKTNLKDHIEMKLPDGLNLECFFDGIPKPQVVWYKDDTKIIPDENRTRITQSGQRLFFQGTIESDEGTYRCSASNKAGKNSTQVEITFTNRSSGMLLYIIISGLLALILICVIILTIKIRKEKKLHAELKAVRLEYFEKGQVESLNPNLGIDDQAELLPYDKKWEFTRDKLKLGKQLGSGAFGVVMKAEAKGIVDGEDSTTVAVKMVKRNADFTYLRALASELKIMAHLGKHVNVVNLLGACTKNIAKRELLVIVEFCQYGNLHNYLLRQRDNFIDQVDMNTGNLDYTIGYDALDRSVSFSSNRSNSQSSKNPVLKYITLQKKSSNSPNNRDQGEHFNKLMADCRGTASPSVKYSVNTESATVMTSPSGSPDDLMMTSNNSSAQPDWRSNYRGVYKGNVQPICTRDLLAWAFQVARGMEYLASRKVLHGDLAARNILLADNNVVKICDFGLAKNMYKNDNYKKKGNLSGWLLNQYVMVFSPRNPMYGLLV